MREEVEWRDYLDGQVQVACANRLTELLETEIAKTANAEERTAALRAWIGLRATKDLFSVTKAREMLGSALASTSVTA